MQMALASGDIASTSDSWDKSMRGASGVAVNNGPVVL
jgi:hypothetical protein